jgi:WXG100 family type VII secretion target
MSNEYVQANYEALDTIAQRFGKQAELTEQMLQRLRHQSQRLQQSWQGRGSDAFSREMESLVLPGIQRLHQAHLQSRAAIQAAKLILQRAENEAAALFRIEGSSTRPPGLMKLGASDIPAQNGGDGGDGGGNNDTVHNILGVLGFIPVVGALFDVADAAIYAAEGRWGDAALSAFGAIPGLGDAGKGIKYGVQAAGALSMVRVTTRAAGDAAQEVVQRAAREAAERVAREGLEGTFDVAQQAARRTNPPEFLPGAVGSDRPGLFMYQQHPRIDGYQQHHIWPQAMGGPKQGWIVYAQNPHNANHMIHGRMNRYLREQTGIADQDALEAFARANPDQILPHLRDFHATEGIPFPY